MQHTVPGIQSVPNAGSCPQSKSSLFFHYQLQRPQEIKAQVLLQMK